jgi:leader peptidase (prepilin peptidase) / N-methyltransferase
MTAPATTGNVVLRPHTTRYLLPAALAGVLVSGLALHRAHSPLHFLLLGGASLLLVALAASDAATMLLPNRLMYPGIAAALLLAGAWPDHTLAASLAGGAAGGAFMLALFLVMPGFGVGDVKLCLLIGLLVGWPHVLTAIVAGIFCSGFVALAGILSGRLRLRGSMPYGPGLVAGALYVLLLLR